MDELTIKSSFVRNIICMFLESIVRKAIGSSSVRLSVGNIGVTFDGDACNFYISSVSGSMSKDDINKLITSKFN